MKILAIDYGTKHVGVATNDDTGTLAIPLTTLIVGRKTNLELVAELAIEKQIELFLIGLPTGLDGKPTKISQEVENFARNLSELTGIPHKFWNETNTSVQAAQRFKDDKNIASHSEAARIMLQEYLDFLKTGI
jgi:putative transcription antitermination factor YqgF